MGVVDGVLELAFFHEAVGADDEGFAVVGVLFEFDGAGVDEGLDVDLVAVRGGERWFLLHELGVLFGDDVGLGVGGALVEVGGGARGGRGAVGTRRWRVRAEHV